MMLKEQYTDAELAELLGEAKFHLGRVLYEGGLDYDRAVSELQEAIDLDRDNAAAYYYYGQAIRAQVERNTLRRAENALRTYLERGAPLGHDNEIREFLGSRRQPEGGPQ
jgi:tetratricopeptide (TPR) repeat protein